MGSYIFSRTLQYVIKHSLHRDKTTGDKKDCNPHAFLLWPVLKTESFWYSIHDTKATLVTWESSMEKEHTMQSSGHESILTVSFIDTLLVLYLNTKKFAAENCEF